MSLTIRLLGRPSLEVAAGEPYRFRSRKSWALGSWEDAVLLPGLGAELLDGVGLRQAPAFDAWLLSERRHVAAISEAVPHEAAVGSLGRRASRAGMRALHVRSLLHGAALGRAGDAAAAALLATTVDRPALAALVGPSRLAAEIATGAP